MQLNKLFATTPKQPLQFCKDCRYFQPHPTSQEPMHGVCTKDPKINMVDGTTEYKNVAVVRDFLCKGKWWETKNYVPDTP